MILKREGELAMIYIVSSGGTDTFFLVDSVNHVSPFSLASMRYSELSFNSTFLDCFELEGLLPEVLT